VDRTLGPVAGGQPARARGPIHRAHRRGAEAVGTAGPLVLDVGCGPCSLGIRLLERLPDASGPPTARPGPSRLSVHVDALRAAGFAEVSTLWQRGASRLLCAIRVAPPPRPAHGGSGSSSGAGVPSLTAGQMKVQRISLFSLRRLRLRQSRPAPAGHRRAAPALIRRRLPRPGPGRAASAWQECGSRAS
jgi:hypothetical protein